MIENPQSITDQVMNLAERASEIAKSQQKRIKSIEQSIPTVTDTYSATSTDAMSGVAVASALQSYVPNTLTINSKELSSDITLSASDIGALSSDTFVPTVTDTYSPTSSDGMSGVAVASAISGVTLSGLGGVPTTRSINGKQLTKNITLSPSDVGALPEDTFIPTITDIYSDSSSDGMSGRAVATAISGKADTSVLKNYLPLSGGTMTGELTGESASFTTLFVDGKNINKLNGSMILGQTVESLIPLTDSGIHLCDGSVIKSGGVYDAFVKYAINLEKQYPELFCTEEDYEKSISDYEVCSKFSKTSSGIRLPKLYCKTRYLVKVWKSGTEWYNLYSDGWCEQGGIGNSWSGNGRIVQELNIDFLDTNYIVLLNTQGNVTDSNTGGVSVSTEDKTTSSFKYSVFDTNRNGNYWRACGYAKEVPDQEKIYRYICIGTSVKTSTEIEIDNIITDLNGKADKEDLIFLTESSQFKEKIISMCSPDYSSIIETTLPYTAPCEGYMYLWVKDPPNGNSIQINDIDIGHMEDVSAGDNSQSFMFALSKGDTFSIGSGGTFKWAKFVPMKGAV